MFRKVMVAIDSSKISQEALREAHNIARSYNGVLCIVHVISNQDLDTEKGSVLLQTAKTFVGEGILVETRLLEADLLYGLTGIADAIADTVNEWKPALLVVGTDNRRGLERFVVGSVAEQVLTKVNTSILLVRPSEQKR